MFSIEVIDLGNAVEGTGRITIAEFSETFPMSFEHWSPDDYRSSWRESFAVLEGGQSGISCLITSMSEPVSTGFVTTWPMYREGDVVHLQNRMLFLGDLDTPFDEHAPWLSMLPHRTFDESGYEISQWDVPVREVRQFFESAR
ncbi:hypothetical protein PV646_36315 [Streptomyces sp. ID05-26A]|nr:hypothetical protein [Streptomyces sp. ID05-26A]